jgi:hypothetical protein
MSKFVDVTFNLEKKMAEQEKKTRKTISNMTAAELKEALEKKKRELEALEAQLHGASLKTLIDEHELVERFKKVKAAASDASDLLILKTLGEAVGIKRLVVTQEEPVSRKRKTIK